MEQRKALGRGLESLIPNLQKNKPETAQNLAVLPEKKENITKNIENNGYLLISLEKIVPNRQQPRSVFDEEKIRELAASIKAEGILQPLVVSPIAHDRYELIAGERRLRAARLAGLHEVPVVLKEAAAENMLVLSILENIQREDLNPIEEAQAYQELVDQYDYSHEQIAQKMGKSRTAVANAIRLLKLPSVIQEDVVKNRYSSGHARAILTLSNIHEQLKLREVIIKNMPTVRDVEQMVRERSERTSFVRRVKTDLPVHLKMLTDKLKNALGVKVAIKSSKNGSGRLIIDYYSQKDLDKIYERLLSS